MMRYLYKVWLPSALLGLWLLLNESFSAGQVALGLVLALWLAWAALRLRPLQAKPRQMWRLAPLFCRVTWDIVQSNLVVARLILSREVQHQPGLVHIPLDMRDPHGLAMLSCIITYTPGTVWIKLTDDHILTLHVLDLQSADEWIQLIKQRYEQPLMAVFDGEVI